jgi:type IV secretion system protein TrbI
MMNLAEYRRSNTRLADFLPWAALVDEGIILIPAALITGIRSDLPGQITAQVTENIYDTPTGRARLIPQGARLIGVYDSQVAFGQSRVLLVWTRLIMPNGRSIVLDERNKEYTVHFRLRLRRAFRELRNWQSVPRRVFWRGR